MVHPQLTALRSLYHPDLTYSTAFLPWTFKDHPYRIKTRCHEPVVEDFSCHVEQPAKLQYCIWKQDVANGKMAQSCLLEIPEHVVASRWLHGARFVDLVDWEREVRYECEFHHTEKGQMFLGRGWYKFAKERCLLDGDSMGFSVKDPISKEILVTMLKN
ncbi:uncharacterized protein LOC131621463 [Vicia villosa]|uniref:uncharacterized protein LOC131621463 n=1 Tax=Vicia villosa TaxID=3911 RepID=UPI00273CF201|nr:uncharacterized protein LOC131621463 [Vicia villosa]